MGIWTWGKAGCLGCLIYSHLGFPVLGKKPKGVQDSMTQPGLAGAYPAGEHSGIIQNKKCEMQHWHYVLRAMWKNWSTSRYRSQKWLFKCGTDIEVKYIWFEPEMIISFQGSVSKGSSAWPCKRRKMFPSLNSTLSPSSMIQKSLALCEM